MPERPEPSPMRQLLTRPPKIVLLYVGGIIVLLLIMLLITGILGDKTKDTEHHGKPSNGAASIGAIRLLGS